MDDHGYSLVNLDSTVVLQRPKISPYIEKMRENIAKILNVEIGQISIKATTEEGMGFCGRGEGSKAMAVVLLAKK
jgi:2-C-methyl-D-erythritol 2,4-cyclodiphosphate synthase